MTRLDTDLEQMYRGRVLFNAKQKEWHVIYRFCELDTKSVYFDTDKFIQDQADTRKYIDKGSQRVYLIDAQQYEVLHPSKVPSDLRDTCKTLRTSSR